MATAPITRSDLIARFPELTDIEPGLAQEVIDEAVERVGEHWPENLRARAQLYLAAHMLAVEGGTQRSVDDATTGQVSGMSEGQLSVQFKTTQVASEGGSNYAETAYGRRFAEIREAAFGGSVFAV